MVRMPFAFLLWPESSGPTNTNSFPRPLPPMTVCEPSKPTIRSYLQFSHVSHMSLLALNSEASHALATPLRFEAQRTISSTIQADRFAFPSAVLPLLPAWSWLALIALHRMQHNPDRIVRSIMRIALTPIVTDCVRKNIPITIECRR